MSVVCCVNSVCCVTVYADYVSIYVAATSGLDDNQHLRDSYPFLRFLWGLAGQYWGLAGQSRGPCRSVLGVLLVSVWGSCWSVWGVLLVSVGSCRSVRGVLLVSTGGLASHVDPPTHRPSTGESTTPYLWLYRGVNNT